MSDSAPGTSTSTGGDVSDPRPGPGGAGPDVTGDDAVDEALARLADVEGLDLRAQLGVFESVHGALQDRLADAEG